MSYTKLNRSAATLTKNRTEGSVSPFSGMCVTCVDGCIGMCEIGKSAYRGAEVLYPQPFGIITAGAEKDYPYDLSHFSIMGTAVGAHGVEADSDKATFEKVTVETAVGVDKSIKLKVPFVVPGMGSTNVAKNNWEGLAIGTAISGGHPDHRRERRGHGRGLGHQERPRPPLARPGEHASSSTRTGRTKGYGAVVVQANVEDTRLGVQEYAIEKLGVDAVELKWGQGAKDIGGEVKIKSLKKGPGTEAPRLHRPSRSGRCRRHPGLRKGQLQGIRAAFACWEWSRKKPSWPGSPSSGKQGAKYVFLKTGAYRPADLARAVKFASKAKLDMLTVDGAGGGTGMSPWRMMNEWGIPSVEIWSLTYNYAHQLAKQGEFVPDLVFAGGVTFEDQIFKALALGAPYVKAVGMARSPAGRGHGREDDRQADRRGPDPGLRRKVREFPRRDLRHLPRAQD